MKRCKRRYPDEPDKFRLSHSAVLSLLLARLKALGMVNGSVKVGHLVVERIHSSGDWQITVLKPGDTIAGITIK